MAVGKSLAEGDGALNIFQVFIVFHRFSLGSLDGLHQFFVLIIESQSYVVGIVF